jgi:hypothetical protein
MTPRLVEAIRPTYKSCRSPRLLQEMEVGVAFSYPRVPSLRFSDQRGSGDLSVAPVVLRGSGLTPTGRDNKLEVGVDAGPRY